MPMSHSQAQAHEAPQVRLQFKLPNGEVHSVTISSTFTPPREELEHTAYRERLLDTVRAFYEPRGITIIRLELVSLVSMEIGL